MTNSEKIKNLIRIFPLVMALFMGGISYAAKYEYIYDDTWHYPPSGWMAENNNTGSMTMDSAYGIDPVEGSNCVKVIIDTTTVRWAGFFVQAKGKWRSEITDTPKGINMSKYTALEIKAKVDTATGDTIQAQFGVGEDGDSYRVTSDWQILTTNWQTYTIDLTSQDLSDINGLLMVNMRRNASDTIIIGVNNLLNISKRYAGQNNMATIYLDDLRYVGAGPANIKDLSASLAPVPGEVTLSWTAPGGTYPNTGYIVKYSTSYISNQADFDNAASYSQYWVPASTGTNEIKTISGLIPGEGYYFAINTVDQNGTQSDLSNSVYAIARTDKIGISVEGNIDLGELAAGQTAVGLTPISVTNIGGIATTLSISVNNPTGWMISNNNEKLGEYILLAAFATNYDKIVWDLNNHGLSTQAEKCTTTLFAGDQTGVNIPVNEIRKLWIRFTAPAITDLGADKQTIFINITANSAN